MSSRLIPSRRLAEPRPNGVHVLTAVRAETGWLMRLEIVEAGRRARHVVVRVPSEASEQDATARILEAVARRCRISVRNGTRGESLRESHQGSGRMLS